MRSKGIIGEDKASKLLLKQGYRIIKRNFFTKFGEIDIIANQENRIHIIEVKLLKQSYINIGYKINYRKQRRMIQSTYIFMDHYKLYNYYYQFDLITIIGDQIKHYKNIFTI